MLLWAQHKIDKKQGITHGRFQQQNIHHLVDRYDHMNSQDDGWMVGLKPLLGPSGEVYNRVNIFKRDTM